MKRFLLFLLIPFALNAQNFKHERAGAVAPDSSWEVGTFGKVVVEDSMRNEGPLLNKGAVTVGTASAGGNLTVFGIISGATPVKLDNAGPTVVLTVDSCRGWVRFNTVAEAKDYTLPGAEAGLVVMFYDIGGGVITIDPVDGTDTIYLDGVSVGAGDAIDSPGAIGNYIGLIAIDNTRWFTLGRSGAWVDGGAD